MNVPGRWIMGLVLAASGFVITVVDWAHADTQQTTMGEKIYAEKQCTICHAIQGKGGKLGPELTDVGAKRDAKWLKTFMRDPKAVLPKAKMLPFHGNAEELEALVAYLSSLK